MVDIVDDTKAHVRPERRPQIKQEQIEKQAINLSKELVYKHEQDNQQNPG